MRDPLDIRLCNCARCNCVMRGQHEHLEDLAIADRRMYPRQVHVRLDDRPYCAFCTGILTMESAEIIA
jgi:hypothetical protein